MTVAAQPASAGFLLDRYEARTLTDEVKQDAEALWKKLLALYNGEAHKALGYSSWGAYFETEFGGSRAYGYRLLEAAKVLDVVRQSPIGDSGPRNEAQARELAPLLDSPEDLIGAWDEAVELHKEPTASDVREVVQRTMGVHYSSKTDLWATPQDLFDKLDAEFGFSLDVCATHENAKCPAYFTEENDGLAQNWQGICWMNPPYGDGIRNWVEKAYKSARSGHATVVCLLPARVDTAWWWDFCRFGEVRFLRGRLKFGGGENSAPFPSAVVIFGSIVPAKTIYWERV